MKLAICYSGAIRSLSEVIDNNLAAFSEFEIDLYFSTWSHLGYSDRINSPDYILGKRTINNAKVTEELIKNIVNKKANIVKIKIDNYLDSDYQFDLINGIDNSGLGAQYFKIKDCVGLLDPRIKYDAIVRMRCDMILNKSMKASDVIELVRGNKIIHPSAIWYNHYKNENNNTINEMLWISNYDLMLQTCNIYSNTDKINDIIRANNETEINYGEKITYMNLIAEGLVSNIKLFDFDYLIVR